MKNMKLKKRRKPLNQSAKSYVVSQETYKKRFLCMSVFILFLFCIIC